MKSKGTLTHTRCDIRYRWLENNRIWFLLHRLFVRLKRQEPGGKIDSIACSGDGFSLPFPKLMIRFSSQSNVKTSIYFQLFLSVFVGILVVCLLLYHHHSGVVGLCMYVSYIERNHNLMINILVDFQSKVNRTHIHANKS